MQELKGKTALVTGASRGIGQAAALVLAEAGVKTVLAARSGAEMGATIADIVAKGGVAEAIQTDVADFAAMEKAVHFCFSRFGGLDILVNNAGMIEPIAPLAEGDPGEWGRLIDVNLKGLYHGMRAALPIMLRQGSGVIVNISSGAATNALEGWSAYCASKAAALMLTRSGHKEYADSGVRVVGLSPGTVATEMQRLIKASGVNPVAQLDWSDHISPEWAGRAVAYLCTEAARDYDGGDMRLRDEEARKRVGLI